jgi:uncharacterized protein YndB with AHSA1/START domain
MTTATNRPAANSTEASEDFESTKTLGAQPDKVLAALRTPEAITDWWGPTEGSAAVGGTLTVTFASHGQVIVLRVEQGEEGQVVWRVEETPRTPEWVGTTIVFDVAASGAGSVLHFRHHGLTPELECFDMCHEGWTHYLGSLVSYVDTGEGQPARHEPAA